MNMIHARVGLQQRILPEYRVEFFDRLATACLQGLSVFADSPRPEEAVETASRLTVANYARAHNLHLFSGKSYCYWQLGVLPWLVRWQPRVLITEINPRNLSNPSAARWMRLRLPYAAIVRLSVASMTPAIVLGAACAAAGAVIRFEVVVSAALTLGYLAAALRFCKREG